MPEVPVPAFVRLAILVGASLMATGTGGAEETAPSEPLPALPEVLAGPDGLTATTPDAWRETVRPHQFALLEQIGRAHV